jgi:DNA polymerase-3 subunit delta'
MSWNNIFGQDRVKTLIQHAIIEEKVAHAYCFWGMEGIGKEALAIEFAKILNCNTPVHEGSNISACGVCSACRMADTLQHPNIMFVYALPTGKGSDNSDSPLAKLSEDQIHSIQEQMELKSKNPYYKFTIAGATQIKIASIRELKRSLSLSSSFEGRRCVIVFRADEMTSEAANAFLKTLEEPHDNVTIILTTSRQDQILPTILSRCQQVHCQPLPDTDLAEAISKQFGVSNTQAILVTAFAQGSYSRAIEFLDEDMQNLRESIVNVLRIALRKKTYRVELLNSIEEIAKEKDKTKLEIFLTLLLIWLRDVLTLSKTGSSANVINADQIETIQSFANNFGERDLHTAIITIEKAIRRIRRNVNQQLILIDLFISLRNVFL